tara:strand:+ start:6608 stop:6823 length:216 start_codon:yes stop_codon:yes gene_type:complete
MKPLNQLPSIGTLLSPKEAQEFIPYGIDWLEKSRKNRSGPTYFLVGRNIFYTPESIKEWTEHQIRKGDISK